MVCTSQCKLVTHRLFFSRDGARALSGRQGDDSWAQTTSSLRAIINDSDTQGKYSGT